MADAVAVVEYDPRWPARFNDERVRLAGAFGDDAVLIEHIGSTAVPGLAAKPIIDILVAARRFPLRAALITAMEEAMKARTDPRSLYWRVDQAGHVTGICADPAEYRERLAAFLALAIPQRQPQPAC